MNETSPIAIVIPKRSLKSSGSTSAPARKVNTIEANEAMNVNQSWLVSMLKTLPITTPSPSSKSATASPSSTERMLATTTAAASTAASWTGSMSDLHEQR
jgi:hypothetical protein